MAKEDYYKDEHEDRVLVLNDVDEDSASSLIKDLFIFAQKSRKKPIYIIVNSYGGDVYEMLAIYDAIQYVKSLGVTVYTMGIGKIMSSGVIVLIAGSIRKIGKYSTIMWHYGASSMSGNLLQIQSELSEFERLEDMANDILSKHTKMTKSQIEKMISTQTDVYLDAEKAIELGMADDFLDMPIDLGIIKQTTQPKKKVATKKKVASKRTSGPRRATKRNKRK